MGADKSKPKKKTKTRLFWDTVKEIVLRPGDIRKNHYDLKEWLKTQTILKRTPEVLGSDEWIYLVLRSLDEYIAKTDKPQFECEYIKTFTDRIWRSRDYWNYYLKLEWIPEYEAFGVAQDCQKRLRERFRELNPEMAEADALLAASMRLYGRSRMKLPEIDRRLAELTNGFDAEIIANLPYMEKVCMEISEIRRLNQIYKESTGKKKKKVPKQGGVSDGV